MTTPYIPLNSGRRVVARPLATADAARVRLCWTNAAGRSLPTITDTATADDAEKLAVSILTACAEARVEHRRLREGS